MNAHSGKTILSFGALQPSKSRQRTTPTTPNSLKKQREKTAQRSQGEEECVCVRAKFMLVSEIKRRYQFCAWILGTNRFPLSVVPLLSDQRADCVFVCGRGDGLMALVCAVTVMCPNTCNGHQQRVGAVIHGGA